MDCPPQQDDYNVQLLKTETLGSGSYGVVCKAMWGQRLCAAKLLHPIFFQSNDPGMVTARRRFEQECRFLNQMKHPNIVEYLGTTNDPDTGLLVLLMELMNESLTHFLEQSQQPLAYHIEVDLCHDIAQALAYIHSKEIIHRDLSGNNVLLIAGKAKITDFGMSKLLDENRRMTSLTTCPGTLAYMPPEALRDPPIYSKKIDCFSFGVLQIQIMTRQFPDPGPAMQVVKDSRSPTGTMSMPVLDSERRKSHIDLISPMHALLPTALSCLSYLEKDRPSAQDLCQKLATFKETPRYTQSIQQALRTLQEQRKEQNRQLHQQLQTLQQELQAKNQQLQDNQRQLQDSQRYIDTLRQELQDSQEQIQQLTRQVKENHYMNDDKDTQLQYLSQQLQANEQLTAEFQQNLLQHEQTEKQLQETVDQLKRDLQQAVEDKLAGEKQLWKLHHQQQKQMATKPQKALMQSKTILDMKWHKESKAPEKMRRGSVASDFNIAYCNGFGSTRVHSYNSDTQKWRQPPDTPHTYSTLVVIQHMLTMVGGYLRPNEATNSLLSLVGEGSNQKWLPRFPSMPTKRSSTAVICSGRSVIVAGGYDGCNILNTVEVLDTDTKQWSIVCSLPHPFSLATMSICGERLYMLGGLDQTSQGTRSVLTCYIVELLQSCQIQPSARKLQTASTNLSTVWQSVADTPHFWSSCATLCGQLFAVGGRDRANKNTAAITAYNETTDTWETMRDMPTARQLALVAILNEKMMIIGGKVGGDYWTASDVVEILY